jgi:hypothetical protein
MPQFSRDANCICRGTSCPVQTSACMNGAVLARDWWLSNGSTCLHCRLLSTLSAPPRLATACSIKIGSNSFLPTSGNTGLFLFLRPRPLVYSGGDTKDVYADIHRLRASSSSSISFRRHSGQRKRKVKSASFSLPALRVAPPPLSGFLFLARVHLSPAPPRPLFCGLSGDNASPR